MSEEVEELDDVEIQPSGTSPMKLLIIFGVLFLLSNGVWGALFFMQGPNAQAATPEESAEKQEDPDGPSISEDELNQPGPVVDLDPFVVNLNEAHGTHYLRTTIKLEIDREETRDPVDMRKVMIRDEFLSILASKQLRELQTGEDRAKLREELLASARKVTSRRAIQAVYFTEFLTQ